MRRVVDIARPAEPIAPLVLDSPHSGVAYPDDFGYAVDFDVLRGGEDPCVDALIAAAPDHGATLVAARFPRTYVDPNRAAHEIDPNLLGEPWPEPLNINDKTRQGAGVVPRLCGPGATPIYRRRLSVAEMRGRLENYWHPYHRALRAELDALHARFGGVWHLDCHSMEAVWGAGWPCAGEAVEYDFILGDRDGETSGAEFTAFLRETLEGLGYRVGVNDGPKGVELVRANGDPAQNRHSVQIEINRALYWDEDAYARSTGWDALCTDLSRLLAAVCAYVREQAG